MTKQDKATIKIKDFTFSIAKESGKVTAHGNIEISDILYHEDKNIKSIERDDGEVTGIGFTVSEAFMNMLDDIETSLKNR